MAQFRAQQKVSGRHVSIHATVDGVVHELGMVKTFESSVESSDTELNTLRGAWTQHVGGPCSGSISLTIYFGCPLFHKMMAEYTQTGIDKYFKLTVANNDPGSDQGAQTVFYQDCRLVSIQPSKADVDTEVLEEDIEINFAGMEYGSNFADNTI
jgi:hypothetical protein